MHKIEFDARFAIQDGANTDFKTFTNANPDVEMNQIKGKF